MRQQNLLMLMGITFVFFLGTLLLMDSGIFQLITFLIFLLSVIFSVYVLRQPSLGTPIRTESKKRNPSQTPPAGRDVTDTDQRSRSENEQKEGVRRGATNQTPEPPGAQPTEKDEPAMGSSGSTPPPAPSEPASKEESEEEEIISFEDVAPDLEAAEDEEEDVILFGDPAPEESAEPEAPTPEPVIDSMEMESDLSVDDEVKEEASESPVHFSAYYPKEVEREKWQSVKAYIYREHVADQVKKDASEQIGEKMAAFRQGTGSASAEVPEGAIIMAMPKLDGFTFNPPMAAIGFYKDWHRLDFECRAEASTELNRSYNGQITFMVEGVIIGDVPLSIYVGENITETTTENQATKIYEAIFASYSHDDNSIVERVERAFKSLGLDYLRDVTTLKSGQHWSDELLELIDRADIFQLFWSEHSSKSDYVKQEWEYALKLDRDDNKFIRPVYWQMPMPEPPEALKHLHFAYQPDLMTE